MGFAQHAPLQSTTVGSRLRITGADWSLEVAGDGSAAEYQNLAVAAPAHSLAKPCRRRYRQPNSSKRAVFLSLPIWLPRLFSDQMKNWSRFARTTAQKAGRTWRLE
jgi:hypothetical protein